MRMMLLLLLLLLLLVPFSILGAGSGRQPQAGTANVTAATPHCICLSPGLSFRRWRTDATMAGTVSDFAASHTLLLLLLLLPAWSSLILLLLLLLLSCSSCCLIEQLSS